MSQDIERYVVEFESEERSGPDSDLRGNARHVDYLVDAPPGGIDGKGGIEGESEVGAGGADVHDADLGRGGPGEPVPGQDERTGSVADVNEGAGPVAQSQLNAAEPHNDYFLAVCPAGPAERERALQEQVV